MTSLVARYEAGEWFEVWAELRHLRPVPPERRAEVEEVASTTMLRAGRQIERIVEQLLAIGFKPENHETGLTTPPPPDVAVRIAAVEASMGPLPEAFKASMQHIGAVSLLGDCPPLGVYYHQSHPSMRTSMPPGPGFPDPLCLPGVELLEWEWENEPQELTAGLFPFAPDELHKANISGGTHGLRLSEGCADPVLLGVAGRPGITLIEYLRVSVAWGGFPGHAFDPAGYPRALEGLRSPPQF